MMGENGEALGSTSVSRRAQHRAELISTVRAHRIRYQEFFEFAPDCQFITDSRGVILEANQAAVVLLGFRKEFQIDKPLGLFVLPGLRSRFYAGLTEVIRNGADEFHTRLKGRGTARDVGVRVAARADAHGEKSLRWIIRDLTEWLQIETARKQLLQKLVTAQEDERRRIACEIHDEMGQHLTALILDLKLLEDTLASSDPARERLDRVRRGAGEIGRSMHRLAIQLRPAALDELGLDATFRNHIGDWARSAGIRADYRSLGPIDQRQPGSIETTLYRIMQEALTNVAKHAGATHVSVILERRDHHLQLIVEDNGRGFDPDPLGDLPLPRNGLGILGMNERASLAGGTVTIESRPGGPTAVYVQIPVPGDGTR
jgi:PAS domain S-box-containing protein